jgi:hypothetical protein
MTSVRKAILFGFLIWLVPFAVAFIIFPLRESSRPLFESIMPVVVTTVAVALAVRYFRQVTRDYVREGVLIGVLWLAICVLIDAPLMLLGGPMQMTLGEYMGDIGLTYVIIPAITVGIGTALGSDRQGSSQAGDAV